jgi:hypothetical protein
VQPLPCLGFGNTDNAAEATRAGTHYITQHHALALMTFNLMMAMAMMLMLSSKRFGNLRRSRSLLYSAFIVESLNSAVW